MNSRESVYVYGMGSLLGCFRDDVIRVLKGGESVFRV